MSTVAENLLDAVDILVDGKLSKLQYNKTIRGRIAELVDDSIGQYKIQYQNSYFTAYSTDSNAKYQKGSEVYVEILSGDFEKNALILGTVQRLGSNYISIIERLDRYTDVGVPISITGGADFCSYDGITNTIIWQEPLEEEINRYFSESDITARSIIRDNIINTLTDVNTDTSINKQDILEYAAAADTLKISMDIKTDLPSEQRTGSGNYGLRIYALYYDEAYVSHDDSELLQRVYSFDVNDMLGQPYRYTSTTNQYGLFPIDKNNFLGIYRIEAFCDSFPHNKEDQPDDIFLSNFELKFLKELSEEELNTTSLKITTPYGGYFTAEGKTKLTLRADLRIKGKKVNYNTQPVDFYWFRKNVAVKTGHDKFSVYGGNGWECLNDVKQPIYKYKVPEVEQEQDENGEYHDKVVVIDGIEYPVYKKDDKGNIIYKTDENGNFIYEAAGSVNFTEFIAGSQNLEIAKDLCSSEETEFKCVAIYKDNNVSVSLTATEIIKNYSNQVKIKLTSDTGTLFSFNIGKTTLHALVNGEEQEGYTYYWSQSIQGGAAQLLDDSKTSSLSVEIATAAASFIKYECSVYTIETEQAPAQLVGSAAITLMNNKESLGSTLVINNGTQIFKYDGYGIAPTSNTFAEADRMVIPTLSFDIYDKEGKVLNIPDNEKPRKMSIRWIWPVVYEQDLDNEDTYTLKKTVSTMLRTDEDLKTIQVPDIANGSRSKSITVLENKPTFTYKIEDRYNAVLANTDAARNNIILEVDYQGEHLVASTNFTFTKEGELGTNGTKYIARIEPIDSYKELFIENNKLYGYTNNFRIDELLTPDQINGIDINTILQAQLWDGSASSVEDIDISQIIWSIASSSTRESKKMLLTIQNNFVKINEEGLNDRIVIQATIPYGKLKYYATYSIPVITGLDNDNKYFWLTGGYSEVMYESDGSRGKFNGLPFDLKFLTPAGYEDIGIIIPDDQLEWEISWGAVPKPVDYTMNQFTIEPPSYYIGEECNQYIKVSYGNYSVKRPIELYLNRYGMSAMNDWDGNSIQISEDGGYILSPQIGAGRKEQDNSFTGITIGEVFQDQNNKEIGMFGYYKGSRSLFLDAETGDAEFGIASKGQIKIRANDGQGTISDGHYHYNHNNPNDPEPGQGLKIKFTSTPKDPSDPNDELGPYIKYGSGNFSVDANGHLIAQGGGTIAGWKITDDYLQSPDRGTLLYSQNGPEEALDSSDDSTAYGTRDWNDSRKLRFNINNRFKIDEEGALKSTAGIIGGWKIGEHRLFAKNDNLETLSLNDNGSIWGPEEKSLYKNYYKIGKIQAVPTIDTTELLPVTLYRDSLKDAYLTYTSLVNNANQNEEPVEQYTYYQYNLDSNEWENITNIQGKKQIGILTAPLELPNDNLDFTTLDLVPNYSYVEYNTNQDTNYYYKTTQNQWRKLNKFSPNSRVWEITPGGVAYFTDVKIRNLPDGEKQGVGENIFQWRGVEKKGNDTTYPVIFELTDSGSTIGGWHISKDKLESGSVKIVSGNEDKPLPVISIGEALAIWGDGTLNSKGSINSSGTMNSSGGFNTSGNVNIQGQGKIGGCILKDGSISGKNFSLGGEVTWLKVDSLRDSKDVTKTNIIWTDGFTAISAEGFLLSLKRETKNVVTDINADGSPVKTDITYVTGWNNTTKIPAKKINTYLGVAPTNASNGSVN